MSFIRFVMLCAILCVNSVQGGSVKNYILDDNCPLDIEIYDIRVSDCEELPCTIRRGKRYTVEGDFSVLRNVSQIVLKCSTIYLGRHIELPGHGGCENLVNNGSCPVESGKVYTSATSFTIPYYVPPRLYTVYCGMADENGEYLMCGWGSGKVV